MNLSVFSRSIVAFPAKNRGGRQRSFAFSVAAELALFASCKNRSNSIAIPRLPPSRAALGFPKMPKFLWLKAPFARKSARFILSSHGDFSGWPR